MDIIICCLLAVIGFALGVWLCRVADSYMRLFIRWRVPTPELLHFACARAFRHRTRVRHERSAGIALGVLMAALWLAPLTPLQVLGLAVALALLLLLGLIDWRVRVLPDALTQPLLWTGLTLAWTGEGLITPELALASCMLSYLALRAVSELYRLVRRREGLGRGDVKLVAAIAAWFGWQDALWIVVLGSVLGLLLALRIMRRVPSLATAQPFGPPLIIATLLIIALRLAEQAR